MAKHTAMKMGKKHKTKEMIRVMEKHGMKGKTMIKMMGR